MVVTQRLGRGEKNRGGGGRSGERKEWWEQSICVIQTPQTIHWIHKLLGVHLVIKIISLIILVKDVGWDNMYLGLWFPVLPQPLSRGEGFSMFLVNHTKGSKTQP